MYGENQRVREYELIDHNGQPFTNDDFQKKKQARAYNRRVEIYLDAFARPKTRSSEAEFVKMLDDKFKKEEKLQINN